MTDDVLLAYDISGIHRYVFAPVRPVDVLGGSSILENFASQAERIVQNHAGTTVYSGGGQGVFHLARESADAAAGALGTALSSATAGAVELVTAMAGAQHNFAAARRELNAALAAARFRAVVAPPSRVLVPGATNQGAVCEGCGVEVGVARDPYRNDLLGKQCQARRAMGRSTGLPSIPRLFELEDDEATVTGGTLAAVYADADRLGAHLAGIASEQHVASLAAHLRAATQAARQAAASAAGGSQRILAPVVGGDDLLVFCNARRLFEVVAAIQTSLANVASTHGIRFSMGIVLGNPTVPLRQYFDEAEAALDEAKGASYRTGQPHVQIHSLMTGRHRRPSGPILPVPLPAAAFNGGPTGGIGDLVGLVGTTKNVGSSQRAGLFLDLSEESTAMSELLVEERAAKDSAVSAAWRNAGALAGRVASGMSAAPPRDLVAGLLRAALVLTDVVQG